MFRLRYRLRHILILLALVGAGLAILVWFEQGLSREHAAEVSIQRRGGQVTWALVGPTWLPNRYRHHIKRVTTADPFRETEAAHDRDPTIDPFATTKVPTCVNATASGRYVDSLSQLSYLEDLSLAGVLLNHDDFVQLQQHRRLRRLDLSNSTSRIELDLLGAIPQLEFLSLADSKIDDNSVSGIAHLKTLHEIDLSGTSISDAGLQHLTGLHELSRLYLSRTCVQGRGLQHLWSLPKLRVLSLDKPGPDTLGGAEGLAALRAVLPGLDNARNSCGNDIDLRTADGLDHLEALTVRNAKLDDESLAAIARMPNLRDIDLSGTNITDQMLEYFKPTGVETLALSDTQTTATGLSTLAEMRQLTSLRIERIPIRGENLRVFRNTRTLQFLALDRLSEASEAIDLIRSLTTLKSIQLTNSQLTSSEIDLIESLSHLRQIDVTGNSDSSRSLIRGKAAMQAIGPNTDRLDL